LVVVQPTPTTKSSVACSVTVNREDGNTVEREQELPVRKVDCADDVATII